MEHMMHYNQKTQVSHTLGVTRHW